MKILAIAICLTFLMNNCFADTGSFVEDLTAGWWGVKDGDSTCEENPHKISISLDEQVLYFMWSKPLREYFSPNSMVASYDIISMSNNSLLLQMQGEKRNTKSGENVKWHLVLDSEYYYWRRDDWPITSKTKNVYRCNKPNKRAN